MLGLSRIDILVHKRILYVFLKLNYQFISDGTRDTEGRDMTNQMGELNSPGKLTTWSNLGSGGTGGSTKQIRMIDGMLFDLHFDLLNLFDYHP